jgi:photosynthetic reaction center cytochrome c subunit
MNRLLWAALGVAVLLSACERPPVKSTQQGYRGTGMVQIDNPRIQAAAAAAQPEVPVLPPPGSNDGPKAKEVYKNVQVLGDLSVGEFTRHMVAITQWVSPEQGCNYCHNAQNFADDSIYTKVVARKMIQMTQHLNVDWNKHVGSTGVTCYTCHRGNPVPKNIWFAPVTPNHNYDKQRISAALGDDAGQNKADPSIALASLPYDPFTPYLASIDSEPIRVNGTTALPTGNRASIKQAEHTYSLMNHMSKSLGVNCTFCHNTNSFQSWDGPPQRVTAYHGIRMVRDVNASYIVPLTDQFPDNRLGPTGDVAKANCATCHQGVNKPLGGLAMAKDWGGLTAISTLAPAAAASAAMADPAAAMPVAAAPAPAPGELPAPGSDPMQSILYFKTGSVALEGAQAEGLDKVVETMKSKPEVSATISGYHSASGTLAQNQDLAKRRAFGVRDALAAKGIDPARVKLEKPVQASANLAGDDPAARRVEVNLK